MVSLQPGFSFRRAAAKGPHETFFRYRADNFAVTGILCGQRAAGASYGEGGRKLFRCPAFEAMRGGSKRAGGGGRARKRGHDSLSLREFGACGTQRKQHSLCKVRRRKCVPCRRRHTCGRDRFGSIARAPRRIDDPPQIREQALHQRPTPLIAGHREGSAFGETDHPFPNSRLDGSHRQTCLAGNLTVGKTGKEGQLDHVPLRWADEIEIDRRAERAPIPNWRTRDQDRDRKKRPLPRLGPPISDELSRSATGRSLDLS